MPQAEYSDYKEKKHGKNSSLPALQESPFLSANNQTPTNDESYDNRYSYI